MRKTFVNPTIDVTHFMTENILTTSGETEAQSLFKGRMASSTGINENDIAVTKLSDFNFVL